MTLAIRSSDILVRLLALLPRSLSAAALTALLETFSALFKYVLIPSDSIQETVWPMFAEVLPKCSPDVQRIIAELWGNILRRLKATTREGCAVAIVKESNEDVGAWVLVTACKVRFHRSRTLQLLTPLLVCLSNFTYNNLFHIRSSDPS